MQQALASTPVHVPFGPTALGAMAERAFVLRPPATHEKKHVLRNEAAILLDRLLTRVARSRGALDVAIGERLVALGLGDRVLRLRCRCASELRREADAHEERQMRARGELDLRVPRHVLALVSTAFRALRAGSERWIPPEECLVRIALHFIEAWRDAVPKPRTPAAKAIARDRGLCQVPGCSRAAAHAHHIRFRSAGGGDEPANLVGLCAPHHLVAIHRGYLRVRGAAPASLRWEVRDHRFAASCLIP